MWIYLRQRLLQLRESKAGATLVYFALTLPIFVSFAGLGFDATLWFMEKRQLQTVVDSSAIAAAYSLSKDDNFQVILQATIADAEENKFYTDADNTITVTSPPTTGAFVGLNNHVVVALSHRANRLFSRILGLEETFIQTQATAAILRVGDHCILALDETRDRALEFSGTSNVDINCGVSSNSSSNESIYLNGSASLTANPSAQAFGDIFQGDNATLNTPNPIQPFSQRSPDPYGPKGRDLKVPVSPSACTENNFTVKKNDPNPVPGRYCGGLSFNAQADVTLAPGVYIIDGGDLTVNGNATIRGDDVTIILTGSTAGDIATVTINGGADIKITAPNFGDYAGIAFFQDPRAVYEDGPNKFLGGAEMNIKGAVYFPGQELQYSGGSDVVSSCLQLIGNKVTFSGNAILFNDQSECEFLGITQISRIIVTLVE